VCSANHCADAQRHNARGAASFRFATPQAWREATQHTHNVYSRFSDRRAESSARVRMKSFEAFAPVHTLKRVLGNALR